MTKPDCPSATAPSTSRRALLGQMLGVGGALVAAACTPAGGPAPTPIAKVADKPAAAAPTTAAAAPTTAAAAPTTSAAAATAAPAGAGQSVSEIVFTNYSTGS